MIDLCCVTAATLVRFRVFFHPKLRGNLQSKCVNMLPPQGLESNHLKKKKSICLVNLGSGAEHCLNYLPSLLKTGQPLAAPLSHISQHTLPYPCLLPSSSSLNHPFILP